MYFYHVSLLPVVALVVVGAHLGLVILQGVSEPEEAWRNPGTGSTQTGKSQAPVFAPFFPHQIAPVLIISFATLGILLLLGGYAVLPPGEPANRFLTPRFIVPEWYFLWAYGLLKWIGWLYDLAHFAPPAAVLGVDLVSAKVVGILLAAAMFIVLLLLPAIDRGKEVRTLRRPVRTTIGVWALGFLASLTLYALNEVVSAQFAIPIDAVNNLLGSTVIIVPALVAAPVYVLLRRYASKTAS
jgi:cytochrome b-561